MDKRKIILIALLAAVVVGAAAGYLTRGRWLPLLPFTKAESESTGRVVYTCPMHPQIIKDRPGDCPICGMSLVKKELDGAPSQGRAKEEIKECYVCPMHPNVVRERQADCPICGMSLVKKETGVISNDGGRDGTEHGEHGGGPQLTLDPRQRALANVATTEAVYKELSQDVYTVGRVAVNEQNLRRVTARYGGRLERLNVNYTGQPVGKGQLIYSIYSPELLSTQKEYLIARQSAARLKASEFPEIARGSEGVLDAARTRMKLWGMTDAQVASLDKTGEVRPVVDVYSPVSGTVMEIKMRQGDYVMEGGEIYTVADLSRVWMLAEVYEYEFSKVGMGSSVEVTADAYPGRKFTGKVSFIQPSVNPESRTVQVRVDLANPGGILKPEMFVNARVLSKPVRGVTVPASAILYTGKHNYAWVEVEPNAFERREVKLGMRSGDLYQVLEGLHEGEMVVSQGGFLIDSEAQLRESASGMAGMPGMEHGGEAAPAQPMPEMEKKGGEAMPPGHRH